MRLRLIIQLNELLAKCLVQHPSFVPSPAVFELEKPAVVPKAAPKQAATDKKKGGKGKKQKKGGATIDETLVNSTQEEEEANSIHTQSSIDANSSKAKKVGGSDKVAKNGLDLHSYRQFFRELDISVFSILKVGLSCKWCCLSESDRITSPGKDKVKLDLPELKFLLEDLSLKLKHALTLSANSGRRVGFTKGEDSRKIGFSNLDHHSPVQIASHMASLFPTLCDLIEEACNFFQAQVKRIVLNQE